MASPEHDQLADTVDMEIVLSGEVVLELDNGVERTLSTGEVNIQNSTRHRWHNRGTAPVSMAVVMVGASRQAPRTPPAQESMR